MASHINFKALLTALMLVSILYACSDSLGIEDNVLKSIIDTTKKVVPVRQKGTLVRLEMFDKYILDYLRRDSNNNNNNHYKIIEWDTTNLNFYAELDTTVRPYRLWLRFDIRNKVDIMFTDRDYWVSALSLKLDSIVPSYIETPINGKLNSGNWSAVTKQFFAFQKKEKSFTGTQSPLNYTMEYQAKPNEKSKEYKIVLTADIPKEEKEIELLSLECTLIIKFPL